MAKVESFEVNHTTLVPGIYLRKTFNLGLGKKVQVWDCRFRAPAGNDVVWNKKHKFKALAPSTMHTIEHLLAYYLREEPIGKKVISVTPMGCATGFYIETTKLQKEQVIYDLMHAIEVIIKDVLVDSDIPGMNFKQCGNPTLKSLLGARYALNSYYQVLGHELYPFDNEYGIPEGETRDLIKISVTSI